MANRSYIVGKILLITRMLNRIQIIQRLINATKAKNYLEIGVNNGKCFLRIKARHKIAVDPAFKIPVGRKLKYFFKNPWNVNNNYFEKTSDDFFQHERQTLASTKPEIVFVDGLHTYEQSLRDVLNSLAVLQDGGIVLMHDCNPITATAAFPASSIDDAKRRLNDYKGVWNGDVWKAIVHMRSLHPDLEVFVLDCDHGVGVVRRNTSTDRLTFSENDIRQLTYEDLERNRKRFLNLKSPDYFEAFVSRVAKM